ncbi:MAG: hypothetical protein C4326_01345 [Ignavibacteria bacterium]
MAAHSIRLLLHNALDYAGLFPPAELSMAEAVRNYAQYRSDQNAWALGRFIVPVARLKEFAREAAPLANDGVWKVSALGGPNLSLEQKIIAEFNSLHIGRLVIDTLEVKATTVEEIRAAVLQAAFPLHLFVEIPIGDDPTPLIAALAEKKHRAKMRTGGMTPEAIPHTQHVARFIIACVRARVPFKATAGLHHPLRAMYHLTYKPNGPTGRMHGHLSVLLAAAFARQGMSLDLLIEVLEEEAADALEFEDTGVRWRGHWLGNDALREAREHTMLAFGSCSFREPIDDLIRLKML